jgi:hypothetical protein
MAISSKNGLFMPENVGWPVGLRLNYLFLKRNAKVSMVKNSYYITIFITFCKHDIVLFSIFSPFGQHIYVREREREREKYQQQQQER